MVTMPIDLPEKTLLLPCEAADALRVSRSTIYRMCGEGVLESSKVRGSLRIPRESVIRLLSEEDEK
jgi:excisionase family DNA binding protein